MMYHYQGGKLQSCSYQHSVLVTSHQVFIKVGFDYWYILYKTVESFLYTSVHNAFVCFQIHEKGLSDKQRSFKELERTIKQKENDNEQLLKELEDLNVSVHERNHIEQVNGNYKYIYNLKTSITL